MTQMDYTFDRQIALEREEARREGTKKDSEKDMKRDGALKYILPFRREIIIQYVVHKSLEFRWRNLRKE